MATQKITVATFGGETAVVISEFYRKWSVSPDCDSIDQFCQALTDTEFRLPALYLYFCQWLDGWLMGDQVPGPGKVSGKHFEFTCLSQPDTIVIAGEIKQQFPEQKWLSNHLLEAVSEVGSMQGNRVVVVRDVLGPSISGDDQRAALSTIPDWLTQFKESVR
jgi:hypothetical protein